MAQPRAWENHQHDISKPTTNFQILDSSVGKEGVGGHVLAKYLNRHTPVLKQWEKINQGGHCPLVESHEDT